MKPVRPTLLIFSLLLFPIQASLQIRTQRPKTAEDDVVRISTTLIQVDATVLDKSGKIVTGLTKDDFEIYENNKRQQITNFSFVELAPDKPKEPITVKPGKNSIPIPPVPIRLRPENLHRTLALVVDDLGLSFGSIDVVKSALKKFVDEQMQPSDLVAIIRTGSGAGVLQQFTSDKRLLYAAIKKVRWSAAGRGSINIFQPIDPSDIDLPPKAGGGGKSEEETVEANKQFNEFREDIFTVGTLGAVNYVIRGMRELPGRKAVVLFSDGFALYEMDKGIKKPNPRLMDNFQRLTDLANRASVIIYTMDARGLVVPMVDSQDAFEDVVKSGSGAEQQVGLDRSTELYETQQGLKALAEQTGGFAVVNSNNLSKGLERVLNDQKGYYLLAYRPDSETFDPKKARFNRLTVKLKRPDLHVRYRSGFFGIKGESAEPLAKTPRQQILAALTSPFNAADIDLRLTSVFADDGQTGPSMRSLLYVSGSDLEFTEEADGWQKATFDVVAMIFTDNGTFVDEVSRTETMRARADTLHEIREKGFVSTIIFPIKKPGAYQMRVVMRDAATSRVGSASQFIEVPNLGKDRLTLSGILLRHLQINSNTGLAPRQFQPDEQRDFATRRFHFGDTLRFDLSVYKAKLNPEAKPKLLIQYRVYRDGKIVFVAPERELALSQQSDLQRIDASGAFVLSKTTPPGNYTLQVIVIDLLAKPENRMATQWTDFDVIE